MSAPFPVSAPPFDDDGAWKFNVANRYCGIARICGRSSQTTPQILTVYTGFSCLFRIADEIFSKVASVG